MSEAYDRSYAPPTFEPLPKSEIVARCKHMLNQPKTQDPQDLYERQRDILRIIAELAGSK